ncbi:hypothetical protein EST38_g2427 [Candolleomyces aberdarensis]|uniref:Glucose-methanol-choline oxidoreductase C-terminal domain-containing protein n=1 Tax=Candolleomyces aberdarensis TaxID=2316362 RepID=A0A4Q2DTL5_9AGAR|nr:hypothetical protein EST38_g2427 [Candolleomyces aberdarensis]
MPSFNPEPLVASTPLHTRNFHQRVGEPRRTPNNAYGFPTPGPQSPTAATATTKHYFVEESTWQDILDHGEYDDVVVGSGLCALAYIDEALEKNPHRKILVLERGESWLPDHFQNLPLPFNLVLGGPSETFPWTLTSRTFRSEVGFLHGSCPFFGGRSTFWSAWCPRAIHGEWDLMRGFPKEVVALCDEPFWKRAETLLHVTTADKLSTPVFGDLQKEIDKRLIDGIQRIRAADFAQPAPLAVARKTSFSKVAFDKFSTPGPLLAIHGRQLELAKNNKGSPLSIATNTVVERFELDVDGDGPDHSAVVLHTSRGTLCFPSGKTNVILAAGAIPATTLLMNSVGEPLKDRAGSRLSGHFLSHIVARFPLTRKVGNLKDHLEIAASYVAGRRKENDHQFHIQVTAIHSPHPKTDAEDAARLCPDYAAAATRQQLEGSEQHVVLVCASLGELSEINKHSWVRHNPDHPDVTTNIRLQIDVAQTDKELWELMDEATYDSINVMAGDESDKIEYWHEDKDAATGKWLSNRAPTGQIHIEGVVHETSTLYMSDNLEGDPTASVGLDYRPRGCKNVYVTGGSLFPSSGSWNPTLTMCGLAQDLANKLYEKNKQGETTK